MGGRLTVGNDALAGATSRRLSRRQWLPALLGAKVEDVARIGHPARCDVCVGCGNKASGQRARQLAEQYGRDFLLLEDGFLRSCGDASDPAAFSICVDDLGIYYDARRESRLEQLISHAATAAEMERAALLVAAWRQGRISKYNNVRDAARMPVDPYVLVVDQTVGDSSVAGACAGAADFIRMLTAAMEENPGVDILVKTHPDVVSGRKQGYLSRLPPAMAKRVRVIASEAHAPDMIEHARAVYTVSSQMGFEALLWGVPVRTFGMPFYSGWGLTLDTMTAPLRRRSVPLLQLVFAALVRYVRYVDPETGQRCEAERAIEYVRLQRMMRSRFPERVHAIGFSRWKRQAARAFFAGSSLTFGSTRRRIPPGTEALAVWGSRQEPMDAGSMPLIRVEDGFLRSVGLGAALTWPVSWVQDMTGIYYDATHPSAIEDLLNEAEFGPELLERARRLRQSIVASRLSKYNLRGRSGWRRPGTSRRVILVVGQVESDASLKFGCSPGLSIATNAGLVGAVRAAHPDAYLVFREHPDVSQGYRDGSGGDPTHYDVVDEVASAAAIEDLLSGVDEVHVMTSLTGFEALLRGVPVITYGLPFYAGWGLTLDRASCCRRRRHVSLDALVAATLIAYPAYICPVSGRFTTPERAISALVSIREGEDPALRSRRAGLCQQFGRLAVRLLVRVRVSGAARRSC